jgi:hypothetical protein
MSATPCVEKDGAKDPPWVGCGRSAGQCARRCESLRTTPSRRFDALLAGATSSPFFKGSRSPPQRLSAGNQGNRGGEPFRRRAVGQGRSVPAIQAGISAIVARRRLS